MKFVYNIFLILFLGFISLNAQNKKIKELETLLASTNDKTEQIKLECRLADMYIKINLQKSFDYLSDAEKKIKKTKVTDQCLVNFYQIYGNAYYFKLNYKKALNYFEKALVIAERNKYKIADTLLYNVATMYYKKGDLKKSQDNYEKLLGKAKSQGNKDLEKELYLTLYKISYERKKYKNSIDYLQKFLELQSKDFYNQMQKITILTKKVKNYNIKLQKTESELEETSEVLKQTDSTLKITLAEKLQLENDTLKKALEIEQLALEKAKKEAEIQRQNLELKVRRQTIVFLAFVLLVVFISGVYIYFLYKKIRKQNHQLEKQKAEIAEKNKQITDSLNYAATIQMAIMPNPRHLSDLLPESCIFFRPRDIVSGDFYWFLEKNKRLFVAAVDCTGHGVPGAMLSMIGNALLNKIVIEKNIESPAEILNNLHFDTLNLLAKSNTGYTQDGMDMVLCTIDKYNDDVYFAGAKNSLYVLNEEGLKSYRGTFASVGYRPLRRDIKIAFKEKKIPAQKGDYLFLASDGITDQFGIIDGKEKKFNLDRYEEMLLEVRNKPLNEYPDFVKETIDEWRQGVSQTDDMLLIVLKL